MNDPSTPGLRRRTVLELPLALAGVLGLGRVARARHRPPTGSVDAFETLAARWRELRAELDLDRANAEESYLRELAVALTDVPPDGYPARERIVYDADGLRTGPAWIGGSIFLVEVELDPGTFLAPHNHPGFCVLTLGIAGSCEVRHYEPEGEAPPAVPDSPDFRVRERVRKWITPGRWSDLTRGRDNIHSFRAGPRGATLLDFTTRLDDDSVGYRSFSALEVDATAVTNTTNVFAARWLGDPYR